jgi:hypothetical protein
MWRCVDPGLTDVSEEIIAFDGGETSVNPGSTQRRVPEDDILQFVLTLINVFSCVKPPSSTLYDSVIRFKSIGTEWAGKRSRLSFERCSVIISAGKWPIVTEGLSLSFCRNTFRGSTSIETRSLPARSLSIHHWWPHPIIRRYIM